VCVLVPTWALYIWLWVHRCQAIGDTDLSVQDRVMVTRLQLNVCGFACTGASLFARHCYGDKRVPDNH